MSDTNWAENISPTSRIMKAETERATQQDWAKDFFRAFLLGKNIDRDTALNMATQNISEEELQNLTLLMWEELKKKETDFAKIYPQAYKVYEQKAKVVKEKAMEWESQDPKNQIKAYNKLLWRIESFTDDMILSANFEKFEKDMDYIKENRHDLLDEESKQRINELDFDVYCQLIKEVYFIWKMEIFEIFEILKSDKDFEENIDKKNEVLKTLIKKTIENWRSPLNPEIFKNLKFK